MNRANVAAWQRFVALDTETHRVQPGLAAPPFVVMSLATWDGQRFTTEIVGGDAEGKQRALDIFLWLLESDRIIVGANIAYDMLVLAVAWARAGRDVMSQIFAKYERGEVLDILISQPLDAIAGGYLNKDPISRGPMRDPISGETTNRYSLAITTYQTLGRKDAKVNDRWRESYALLDGVPIAQWPPDARDYPQDDVRNTLECALAHCGHIPKAVAHRWRDVVQAHDMMGAACSRCGSDGSAPCLSTGQSRCERCQTLMSEDVAPCRELSVHRNIHALSNQTYTAWALALGAAWGFTVDQRKVDVVEDEVAAVIKEDQGRLIEWGFLAEDGSGEGCKGPVARAVAEAYGATGDCATCGGGGKVTSPRAPLVRCKACKGKGILPGQIQWATCVDCVGQGKVVSQSDTYKVNCKDCCATGLDLATAPMLKMTDASEKFPKGQVAAGRDALNESGDDKLMVLADYQKAVTKTQGTYIPYLRRARVACVDASGAPVIGFDGQPVYVSKPLTLRPNVLLETDRTSYSDPVQQFPRVGGLRGCIVARPGFFLASVDWSYGELITWAEGCLDLLGHSELAVALLEGSEPHKALAAEMMGVTYEQLDAWFRDKKSDRHKFAKAMRQASKPGNFMFPGGGGVPTFVEIQRKNGPDTPCELGPMWLDKAAGIRGYRGTRFCVLMDGAKRCGFDADGNPSKVNEWNENPCSPLCRGCLEAVARLHAGWKAKWREARPYFSLVTQVKDRGQTITSKMLDAWPWLREVYTPGQQLPPGTFLQLYSGIARGDCGFCDGANGWFQSRLAVAGKRALRRAQRECVDPSVVVNGGRSPLYGSRVVAFQHDECLAELRQDRAHEAAHRLSDIMCQALREVCPRMAKAVKAPPALMRFWAKDAEPTYLCSHERGEKPHCPEARLVPWEPSK